jgi:WD40 repeat protein
MDRSLRCWALATGDSMAITSVQGGHTEPVTCLEAITVLGVEYVVSGGADSLLKIWNLDKLVLSDNQGAVVTALKASMDAHGNPLLMVGLVDGRINIRSGESMTLLCRLDSHILCHQGAVWAIENCGNGFFASGGEDGKLILWQINGNMKDEKS